ncbi:hypothetical protein PCCS19_16500 [Paenibacillus sp. CCS19]|uniref:non-ribosomal peptide synthetase n=1 Tax=Paenibacillus sp. CCS19 TaxID=3158387 RepID=UPI0025624CF3|nr:non-ribosomal peptide synthetase [Paenibacillus cellulosilyticus]GMK38596.1 hypothetical protein PCCS19_16500 [Paenibacillus cellulosilyticus]
MNGEITVVRGSEPKSAIASIEEKQYWMNELQGALAMGEFPSDCHMDGLLEDSFSTFKLPRSAGDRLDQITGGADFGAYVIWLAAVQYLLYRYSGKTDFIIGMPAFLGEPTERKLAPVRARLSAELTFKQQLQALAHQCNRVKKYKNVTLESLLPQLTLDNVEEDAPLFRTAAAYRGSHHWEPKAAPISFLFGSVQGEHQFELHYDENLYSRAMIQRMGIHLLQIVQEVLRTPDMPLFAVQMLTVEERHRMIVGWNKTEVNNEEPQTIHHLIEEQARSNPGRIALHCSGETMSYGELNARANRIASLLRAQGVGTGDIVGLMIQRGFDMIAGLLAVLKSGAAYLPIDPDFPADRIEYMLKDSEAKLLLTETACHSRFEGIAALESLLLDTVDLAPYAAGDLPNVNTPSDLAYVIYTSGSTGKPKGVMLEHRSVHNFIVGMTNEIGFAPNRRILNLTTISFDIFVLESIVPLARGMSIVIAQESAQKDPFKLCELLKEHDVHMLQITPSRLQLFLVSGVDMSCFRQLTDILIGGEALPSQLVDRLCEVTHARIYNMYGPTETTVWSAVQRVRRGAPIYLGSPIVNTQLYIVNEANLLQPIGVPGELCIGGDGLARGYWRREELTASRFVPNPYEPGAIMYKTGDVARRLADGSIEFLGRSDFQVKIRGYRIELGEIEHRLLGIGGVKQCVVIAEEDGAGDKSLIAYYASEEERPVKLLRSKLAEELPDYMIPTQFVHLLEMPMTPNGKLDRNRLPKQADRLIVSSPTCEQPRNDTEMAIQRVWTQVLKREVPPGVHDSFFDVGGNSTLLVMAHAKLGKLYPGRLEVADLFTHPTIAELASWIDGAQAAWSGEELAGLPLEPSYYNKYGEEAGEHVLELAVSEEFCQQVMKTASSAGADLYDLAAISYLYTLAEASESEEVEIELLSEERDNVYKLYANFAAITTVQELLAMAKEQRRHYGDSSTGCPLDQYVQLRSAHRLPDNQVSAVFIAGDIRNHGLQSSVDLVLAVKPAAGTFKITLEFNGRKLLQSAMEELLYKYTDIFLEIINLLSGREERYA